MKKITILALHLNFGGVEKYISSLCKMLEDSYDVELIVTYECPPAFSFSDKIKIKYLINGMPNKEEFKKNLKKKKILKVITEGIKAVKIIFLKRYLNIKNIKNINSDYIITTRTFHNSLVSKYAKKDIIKIATEHNYHNNDEQYVKKLIKSLKNYDYLVTVSKELKEYYQNKFLNAKIVYIPNTLDYMPLNKSNLNTNNIISVGRFSKEKGFDDLIDIFKNVNEFKPSSKLYLIGNGEQMSLIKAKVKEYNLEDKVILPGFLSQEELENYYLNSKLYVMTSYTESFGLVLIEAMSYGIPCLAFDCASGAREIINKSNGVLIENRDKKEMSNSIIELLSNSNKVDKLSNKAVQTSKLYFMGNIKNLWITLLEEKKNKV